MRTVKISSLVFVLSLIFAFSTFSQVQTTKPISKSNVKKQSFPEFSIAPTGGAIFPTSKEFRNDFKPGGIAGLDLGLKINKEVAVYGKFTYMFLSSKNQELQ